MPDRFHDYLGLLRRDLSALRTLVFCGRSGSGKSRYIRELQAAQPDCAGTAVVDELIRVRDLGALFSNYPYSRGPLLIASHLPPPLHWPLRLFGPLRLIRLDRQPGKLAPWLAARNVEASAHALVEFERIYGANYTDAAIVIESAPGASFDSAWAMFRRERRIRHEPVV